MSDASKVQTPGTAPMETNGDDDLDMDFVRGADYIEAAIDAKIKAEAALRQEAKIKDSLANNKKNTLPLSPQHPPLAPTLNPIPSLMSINTSKPSFASKAKEAKNKERVEDILHVYSSKNRKSPISALEWEYIESHLITLHTMHVLSDKSDPKAVRVAHSGFDDKHGCGFIACRDSDSANWHKEAIKSIEGSGGLVFRAWAKGDLPEVRLCRLYLPSRFQDIPVEKILELIKAYNPPIKNGTLIFKNSEPTKNQGGTALFIEFDADSYTYIRDNKYKIEFILGDIDCHGVMTNPAPKNKPTPTTTSTPAPESDSSSASRSGAAAILPAHAAAELSKMERATSSRDPRVKKILDKATESQAHSDDEDGYSTTSSRGSAKYKPPTRKSSPSADRGRAAAKTDSPLKRGREPSKPGHGDKKSPGAAAPPKRDKKRR